MVLADTSLALPDFRAAERTFQLLTQVAGRAGRGADAGRVLIQTFNPRTPAVARAVLHDYAGFAEEELARRQALGYPPFARLMAVRVEGSEEGARRTAEALGRGGPPGARRRGRRCSARPRPPSSGSAGRAAGTCSSAPAATRRSCGSTGRSPRSPTARPAAPASGSTWIPIP